MNLILTVISILLIVMFGINRIINYNRFKHINKLKTAYSEMEMYFVRNSIHLKKDYIEFLKVFKNLTMNPDYLDIQILLLFVSTDNAQKKLNENKKWFDSTLESLGVDFKPLYDDFDKSTNSIIALSFLKFDFVFYLMRVIVSRGLTSGVDSVKKLAGEFRFAKENDEAISYSSMNLNLG